MNPESLLQKASGGRKPPEEPSADSGFAAPQGAYAPRSPALVILASCCVLAVLAGCGGPTHVPVHGRVTLANQPVEIGEVRFVPLDNPADGSARPRVVLAVVAGDYRATTNGGIKAGQYRVEVEVRKKTGKKALVQVGMEKVLGDQTVRISPARYAGDQSPLAYTAGSGAGSRFDIDLPAGP